MAIGNPPNIQHIIVIFLNISTQQLSICIKLVVSWTRMASVLCLIPCNQNHNCTKILHLGAQKGSMRCSFVKCESGNDLKWKEINRMLPSKLWKVVLLEIGSTALQMVSQPLRWMVSFFLMVFLDYLCSLAQGAISWSDSMEVVSYIEVVYNIGVSCLLTINRQYIHLLI